MRNVHSEATERASRTTALSVRNDAAVNSVTNAVRRRPLRSRFARGVTATVSSHSPAAKGRRAIESASMRTSASPPARRLSATL